MYLDPQQVTVNTVAISLPRVGTVNPTTIGSFRSGDAQYELTVHQLLSRQNRCRREVRLTQRKIAADPISAVNKEVSASVVIVYDAPKTGFSNLDLSHLSNALIAWFTAAQRDKLLGGEL